MDYISASQVSTFLKCPLAYKKKYVDKIKEPRTAMQIYTSY
jgi:hypothetical protein